MLAANADMKDYQREFLEFALSVRVLRFGDFTLKSGRRSPYFFNTGLFNSGAGLSRLGGYYARAILDTGCRFDVLFGPAYKGIPLVTATVIALAEHHGRDAPYAFNRKEAKRHGEGGVVVGAPLSGEVMIIDDVISSGLSVDESVDIITDAGARPCGVFIALDRQERGRETGKSAAFEVQARHGMPVRSIVSLATMVRYLEEHRDMRAHLDAILAYRERYGAA
jgi:orotate phosphoribosyltransferase